MTGELMRRRLLFHALMACALTLAGCASPTDDSPTGGSPSDGSAEQQAPANSGPPPIVSPADLDVGEYPTTPRPPLGVAGSPAAGAVADAQHMADFVIGPWNVDEKLVDPYVDSLAVLSSPADLLGLGPEAMSAAAGRHGFVNGFASLRQVPDTTAMVTAVFRFVDPPSAVAASAEMGEATATQAVKGVLPAGATIPGHPESVASTYEFTPTGAGPPRASVRSFTPYGPYVFMQFVQSVDGFDAAAALAAKAIDAQGPAIDGFTPAEPTALAQVQLDPNGLLAKTLPAPATTPTTNAVYGARGAEHFQTDPIASATLFKDTGVSKVALGGTNVYEARNAQSAVMITNAFSQEISDGGNASADPAKGLPNSRCKALAKGFYCVVSGDRYAIEATGAELLDTQQKLAAQYVMLTAG